MRILDSRNFPKFSEVILIFLAHSWRFSVRYIFLPNHQHIKSYYVDCRGVLGNLNFYSSKYLNSHPYRTFLFALQVILIFSFSVVLYTLQFSYLSDYQHIKSCYIDCSGVLGNFNFHISKYFHSHSYRTFLVALLFFNFDSLYRTNTIVRN